jgi:hypothetical protein
MEHIVASFVANVPNRNSSLLKVLKAHPSKTTTGPAEAPKIRERKKDYIYHTHAIINYGLYILNPFL